MKEFKIDLSMYEGKVREVVSEAVQRKAFELGYGGWLSCGKNIAHSDMPYLFIGLNDIGMCEDYQRKDFKDYPRPEISAADFLALTPEDVKDAPKEPEFKIDLSMYEGKVREVVSEAVQRKAFELGYGGWLSCGKNIAHSDMPYLFIGLNDIGMGEDYQRKDFKDYPRPEISAADFLALTPEDVKDAPKEPEFKPFDRVLVRYDDDDEWHIDFFEGMNKDKDEPYTYQCINSFWRHCIPYEGNEHLLGTMEDVK